MSGLFGLGKRCSWAHLTRAGSSQIPNRLQAGSPGAPTFLRLGLRLGDYRRGLCRLILPAVEHLPRPDKDARSGRRNAITRNIQVRDITIARFRCRQHAQDREMLGKADARAARTRPQYQNHGRGRARHAQLQFRHATRVRDHQRIHRVGVEPDSLGWSNHELLTLVSQRRINLYEEQVARETA